MKTASIFLVILNVAALSGVFELSPALSDDAISSVINPAALSVGRGSNLSVNSSVRADSFMVAGLSAGRFGIGYLRKDSTTSLFMSTGYRISKNLSWGTRFGYEYKDGNSDGYLFDLGAMWRPVSWFSLGMSTDRLAGGNGKMNLNAGAALKLFDMLIVGGASNYTEKKWSDLDITAAILLEGIRIYTDYSFHNKSMSAGLSFSFGNLEAGYLHPVSSSSGNQRVALWAGRDIKPSIINSQRNIAVVNIDGALIDALPEFTVMGGASGKRLSDVLVQLRNAARDKDIRQVVLRIGNFRAGLGMIDEIRSAVKDLRLAGKRTVACLENVDLSSYYLAVSADRIVVEPLATWIMTGISAEIPFYKGLLDKIGIKAQFEKVGEYKNYPEVFTEDSMSAAFRENEIMLLSGWYNYLVDNIVTDRGVDRDTLTSVLDRGTVTLDEAIKKGLISETGYFSDIVGELAGRTERTSNLLARTYYNESWHLRNRIAIVVIEGTIIGGESFTDIFSGESFAGSKTICAILRKLRHDKNVKAVLLRINSPGGSGTASDQIWREVRKIKEAGKPVIASVGDVAASGGYFVMADADAIVAGEGSVVGSIGVFAGKFVLRGLYDKLGIRKESINFGANADVFSDYKEFTEEQRATLKSSLEGFYKGFLQRVSEGRRISVDSANTLGRGRIFTGSQAKERGLVDEIGGMAEAIEIARKKAKIDNSKESVGIDVYPKPRGFFSELSERESRASRNILRAMKELNSHSILAIMPYKYRIGD